MSKIKLQVGKTYRSRKGEEVKIVKNDGIVEYSYEGSDGEWYTESGKWSYVSKEHPKDLIEEVPSEPTRHTFDIPDGVKKITVSQVGNCIVVEMALEKEPKPGDVMINKHGSVYIFKEVKYNGEGHNYFAWLGSSGRLAYNNVALPGRPATPEEAQPLWDALKKAGKRWNPETMQVEDIPESDRIREWVGENIEYRHYTKEVIAEAIEEYLKYREGEKRKTLNAGQLGKYPMQLRQRSNRNLKKNKPL